MKNNILGIITGICIASASPALMEGAEKEADQKKVAAVRHYTPEQQTKLAELHEQLNALEFDEVWGKQIQLARSAIERDKIHPDDIRMHGCTMLGLLVGFQDDIYASHIHYLLQRGADANSMTQSETPMLFISSKASSARLLLQHGAEVRRKDNLGRSRLHMIEKDPRLVYLFWQAGADVAEDECGRSPILQASLLGATYSIPWLVNLIKVGSPVDRPFSPHDVYASWGTYEKALERRMNQGSYSKEQRTVVWQQIAAAKAEVDALPEREKAMVPLVQEKISNKSLCVLIAKLANAVPVSVDQEIDQMHAECDQAILGDSHKVQLKQQ